MYNYILDLLPYKSSFRFVEEISYLDADKVIGHYTLKPDAFFYVDHFVGNPVTPGAILTEIMAQIGLVVLGIYLITEGKDPRAEMPGSTWAGPGGSTSAEYLVSADVGTGSPIGTGRSTSADDRTTSTMDDVFPLLSSANVEFFKMALPGQRLTVTSKKDYFRFDKLKCQVEMHDAAGERVARGVFSGFLKRAAERGF